MTTPAPPERPDLDERAPISNPELDEPTPRPFGGVDPLRHGRDAATAVPFPEAQGEPHEHAVDVRIVDNITPPTKRNRFTAGTVRIDPANGRQALIVLGHRQNRTKTRFVYKRALGDAQAPGRVWISADESPMPGTGFPLDENDTLDLNTTEDVWVALDPAAANPGLLCVYTEFATEIEEFVPGDKHPYKGGLFDRFFGDRETRL